MKKSIREKVRLKYGERCAYSGTRLDDDWQVDHLIPIRNGGTDDIDNLMPCQKILNHYKRALTLERFRVNWLGGLHKRISKLPKHPRTEKSKKHKAYMLKIAGYFDITPDKPFTGTFYFEKINL